jgi:hypothetical protein
MRSPQSQIHSLSPSGGEGWGEGVVQQARLRGCPHQHRRDDFEDSCLARPLTLPSPPLEEREKRAGRHHPYLGV